MSDPDHCPRIEEWQELFGAVVAPERWEAYERHLESCPDCQASLDSSLVRPDDLTRVNVAFFHVNAVVSIGLFLVGTADLLLPLK